MMEHLTPAVIYATITISIVRRGFMTKIPEDAMFIHRLALLRITVSRRDVLEDIRLCQ